jgi:hypothetical protein
MAGDKPDGHFLRKGKAKLRRGQAEEIGFARELSGLRIEEFAIET